MNNYSVLMAVYYKENPKYLDESIKSIMNQTVKTNDFVLVCDGELNKELDEVIEKYKTLYPNIFNVIRLKVNGGLGNALNIGIKACKNSLIGRMDSDDISIPTRMEKQLKLFNEDQKLCIVGSSVTEFKGEVFKNKRVLPCNSEEIVTFSKKRNPFNHPSVMFKKDIAISVGSYKHMPYMEDYFLWIRILEKGFKGVNIEESLVYMRIDDNTYKRRAGFKLVKSIFTLRSYMLKGKYINILEFIYFAFGQSFVSLIPNSIRKEVYKRVLRT